jgi:uncharacterized cupin superfamily protein
MTDTQIRVVRSADETGWTALVDPPGAAGSPGAEQDVFVAGPGRLTTGLWRREPDTWSFVRPYHEVAVILEGDADIVADDGSVHTIGPGDVLVTPKGSAGTWVIRETIVKSYTILEVD